MNKVTSKKPRRQDFSSRFARAVVDFNYQEPEKTPQDFNPGMIITPIDRSEVKRLRERATVQELWDSLVDVITETTTTAEVRGKVIDYFSPRNFETVGEYGEYRLNQLARKIGKEIALVEGKVSEGCLILTIVVNDFKPDDFYTHIVVPLFDMGALYWNLLAQYIRNHRDLGCKSFSVQPLIIYIGDPEILNIEPCILVANFLRGVHRLNNVTRSSYEN